MSGIHGCLLFCFKSRRYPPIAILLHFNKQLSIVDYNLWYQCCVLQSAFTLYILHQVGIFSCFQRIPLSIWEMIDISALISVFYRLPCKISLQWMIPHDFTRLRCLGYPFFKILSLQILVCSLRSIQVILI